MAAACRASIRRSLAVAAAAALAAASPAAAYALGAGPLPRGAVDVSTIRSDQKAVVSATYAAEIRAAQSDVDTAQAVLTGDSNAVADAKAQEESAGAAITALEQKAASDEASLAAAVQEEQRTRSVLSTDRARLRAMALGYYVGGRKDLSPPAYTGLQPAQKLLYARTDVAVVLDMVEKDVRADTAAAQSARQAHQSWEGTVAADDAGLAAKRATVAAARVRAASSSSALAADQQRLGSARDRLASLAGEESSAVAALSGPPLPTDGLSVVGASALTPTQLADWFYARGYIDLTAASVYQLASWYVQLGSAEGVRGDVAFAQAVLETGGFASPDAVNLNNYAGIGHCDSCSSGWSFPTPQSGVVGQLQLLRIFADADPPTSAPAPVLAALTPSRQPRSGCCASWESLTGVWATDPFYGSSILTMYQSMLTRALGGAGG